MDSIAPTDAAGELDRGDGRSRVCMPSTRFVSGWIRALPDFDHRCCRSRDRRHLLEETP